MKKATFTLAILFAAGMAQAQKATDSTACQKLQAKIDQTRLIYADSFEKMRANFVAKNQDARRQFMKDSLAGKVEKGAVAPTAMNPTTSKLIKELKMREFALIRPWQMKMKEEKCQESGKMPEKEAQNKK